MEKYNKLTKVLLERGYSAENFPEDKVRIAGGRYSRNGNPLDNIYGGFEYNRAYCNTLVYKTGCGMHVTGRNVISNMGFKGEEWCHENDNPVIRCPYDKSDCSMNDKRLHGMRGSGLCIQCFCVCHKTNEPYDYGNSFEKAEKERQEEKERKYKEFSDAHGGRICENHMYYNERSREWRMVYEPSNCAAMCYSQNGFCPILGRKLSTKRGNVYYDLKTSSILKQRDAQTSLFDGSAWTHIEKGIRFFKKPCSMDICEAFVKVQSDEILKRYKLNHSTAFASDKNLTGEVMNVRAEAKPSRDLLQDLHDIKDGITITHASDMEKREKEHNNKKRGEAQQKKIKKLEEKLIKVGYENLYPYSLDRVHADKWLECGRLEELKQIRSQKLREEQERPVQMSMFDFLGGD